MSSEYRNQGDVSPSKLFKSQLQEKIHIRIRSLEDFVVEVNWRFRETKVMSRQGRQTALSFLYDKIL